MPKLTKDQIIQIIKNLQNMLQDSENENSVLKAQLKHVGDYARDAGIFSADEDDTTPAEIGSNEWSEALEQVVHHTRYLRGEMNVLRQQKALIEARVSGLSADVTTKQGIVHAQVREIERLTNQVQTVAGGLKRRHETIEAVRVILGPPGQPGEPMTDTEERFLREILRVANID